MMEQAGDGSNGRMRILERDAKPVSAPTLTPTPPPGITPARRTHALPRPFEARLVVDGKQFAMRAEPMGGVGQYRLRVWVGTPDGHWKALEGTHSNQMWDVLADPLSVGMRVIAAYVGYRV